MATTGLGEFTEVLGDFRQLGSLALKGAVAAPLANLWLKLGPPPTNAIAVLTSLAEFVTVVWVFHFWHDANEGQIKTRMKVSLVCFVAGLVACLVLLEQLTVTPGPGRDRIIIGFRIRPDVQPILTTKYKAEDAMRDNEYDADKVWTRESISIARISVTLTWLFSFSCLAIYLTAFIMSQRRRSALAMPDSPL
jgi:hypothetical protein